MSSSRAFDKDYYDRYYRDPKTQVASQESVQLLADFVCSYLLHVGQTVRRVLDIGCGVGYWRAAIATHFPEAKYQGVEFSEHVCQEYGWTQGSVVDFHLRHPADLVICQGVLQYLDDRDCKAAVANLGRLTGGALYLEALTQQDWEENCDQEVTDGDVHLRTGAWYRRELGKWATNCGGGVFLAEASDASLFELERLD
jgi:SAM-dependent methyltransferase